MNRKQIAFNVAEKHSVCKGVAQILSNNSNRTVNNLFKHTIKYKIRQIHFLNIILFMNLTMH